MDATKIVLGWPNRVDQANLSGGNWQSALPLTNTQTRIPGRKARAVDATAASTKFDISLDTVRPISALAIAGHNMSPDARMRVRMYSDYAKANLMWDSAPVHTNYLQQSQAFDQAVWLLNSSLPPTITPDTDMAPDGTQTADSITFGAAANSGVRQNVTVAAGPCVISVWARIASGTHQIRIWFINGLNTFQSPTFTVTTTWQRFSFAVTSTGVASSIFFMNQSGTVNTIALWGAQYEPGTVPSEYLPTFGAAKINQQYSYSNLALYSSQFDQGSWTKNVSTISASNILSPDGVTFGQKLVEFGGASNLHNVTQNISGVTANSAYTFSVYVQSAERQGVALNVTQVGGGGGNSIAYFNVVTGAIFNIGSVGTISQLSQSITSVGNGWYRCAITVVIGAPTSLNCAVFTHNNSTTNYPGDGNSGVYIWGAMLENSKELHPYQPTSFQAVTNLDYGIQGAVWPSNYQLDTIEWEDNGFWLQNQTFDPTKSYVPLATVIADQPYLIRVIAVELFDTTNPQQYVEIGRVFVSTTYQPTINAQYGMDFGFVNVTEVDTVLSQNEYFYVNPQARTTAFTLANEPETEAFQVLQALQRDQGIDKEILFAYTPDQTDPNYFNRTFLARNTAINPISQPYFKRHNVNFNLKELI